MRVISILERLPLLGFATLAFMCGSSVVSAQEGADQSTGGLEEIIVSARRRAESLQDVPVAVQAFSAQQIENAGIRNFEEIVSRTPGMVFSQSNGLDHEIFIRGIGSDIQGAGADNAIGIFVDGVYMSRNSGSQLGLYDLERVEVLKGPQSLRFGKNIVGGLIHYVTKKPTDEFEGSLEFSYGDYDQIGISAAARGPVSDGVNYALTAVSNVHSGYAENTRGEDAEDQNRSAVRGHLQIDATDNTVVLLSADYNRNRSTGRWRDVAVANDSEAVTFNGFFADPIPGLPGFVLPDRSAPWQNSDRRSGPKNLVGNNDHDVYGGSARIEWSGSNGLSLTSITAYREADIASLDESCGVFWDHPFATREAGLSVPDPSAAILAGDVFNYLATVPDCWFEQMKTDDTKQISQELRLSGGNDGAISWSAGLYYLDEDISRSEIVAFSFPDFSVITEFAGCTFGGSIDFCGPPSGLVETEGVSRATTLSDAQNFGAFGEITYDLSDTISLNVGVRWVSDDKDFTVARSGQTFDAPICDPDGMGVLPPGCLVAGSYTATQSESWDEVLPSISLNYKPTDSATYYARFEQGYKPGGWFGENAPEPRDALISFDPEFANAFEVGGKLLFADHRVRLNIAAHFTEYEDLQINQFIAADPTRPPDNFTTNATNGTEAYGVEIDFEAAVSDDLNLYGNYAFTKCEFSGVLIVDDDGTDLNGNTCRRTPEHGFNIGVDYAVPINDQYLFRLGGDYQWKDEYFFDNFNSAFLTVDSETLLNLRGGVSAIDDAWALQFWVKNVTDELNIASVSDIGFGSLLATYNAPRTYGVTFRRRF